ncbi:hypothetical protein [Mucilaginibacter sp.]|uniref:hypothetical protein n=1 Tax=Mucilaginibacter sp. TaxID=1882438 RepID=UPI0035BC7106
MAAPKKPLNTSTKKISDEDDDDLDDDPTPGKKVADDDDDFDEEIPLDDDLGRYESFEPFDDEDDD